jgi:hypothetical protein
MRGISVEKAMNMKKKVTRPKLGTGVNVDMAKQIENERLRRMAEDWKTERGKQAVCALQDLTEAGVIEWRIGEGWARACLSVRLEELKTRNGVNRVLRLTNDHAIDERGEPRETSFNLDADECKMLFISIIGDRCFR